MNHWLPALLLLAPGTRQVLAGQTTNCIVGMLTAGHRQPGKMLHAAGGGCTPKQAKLNITGEFYQQQRRHRLSSREADLGGPIAPV